MVCVAWVVLWEGFLMFGAMPCLFGGSITAISYHVLLEEGGLLSRIQSFCSLGGGI